MLGLAVTMPQTTSLSSVAAAVPNRDGTRVNASRSSLTITWRVMPITLPQVSTEVTLLALADGAAFELAGLVDLFELRRLAELDAVHVLEVGGGRLA